MSLVQSRRASRSVRATIALVALFAVAGCGDQNGRSPSAENVEPDYREETVSELVEVRGNDQGYPNRVLPDGTFAPGDTLSECSTGAFLADRVVRVSLPGERRQVAVSEFGDSTLFDTWDVEPAVDVHISDVLREFDQLELDRSIEELRADAGTLLAGLWSGRESAERSYLIFGRQHHGKPTVMFVDVVGHVGDDGFVFDHPCPNVLNSELELASDLASTPTDEGLAIQILTDKSSSGTAGHLLWQSLSNPDSGASALAEWNRTPSEQRDLSVIGSIPETYREDFRPLVIDLEPSSEELTGQLTVDSKSGVSYTGDASIRTDLVIAIPVNDEVLITLRDDAGRVVGEPQRIASDDEYRGIEIIATRTGLGVSELSRLPAGLETDSAIDDWFAQFFFATPSP